MELGEEMVNLKWGMGNAKSIAPDKDEVNCGKMSPI